MDANQEARNRELARSLGCITSGEFRELANITESTEEAWRKRGTGPSVIRLGRTYLYPVKALAQHLEALTKHRPPLLLRACCESPAFGRLRRQGHASRIRERAEAWFNRQCEIIALSMGPAKWEEHRAWIEDHLREVIRERLIARGWRLKK